jgi:chaperone modulatory protein CbpM
MRLELEAVIALVPGVAAPELRDWIERGWVLPSGEAPDWRFAETDVARIRLLHDLRHVIGVEEETLPLVLSLLDQVYDLRRRLRAVLEAAEQQPQEVREALRAAVRARLG